MRNKLFLCISIVLASCNISNKSVGNAGLYKQKVLTVPELFYYKSCLNKNVIVIDFKLQLNDDSTFSYAYCSKPDFAIGRWTFIDDSIHLSKVKLSDGTTPLSTSHSLAVYKDYILWPIYNDSLLSDYKVVILERVNPED